MTLLGALATYLATLPITGPFPLGEIADSTTTTCTLLQLVAGGEDDPTRTHLDVVVQLFIRRTTQALAHADAWTAYRALNMTRPLPGAYRAMRTRCEGRPIPLGRDTNRPALWNYSLDVTVTGPYLTVI